MRLGRKSFLVASLHMLAWALFIACAVLLKVYAADWIDRFGSAVAVVGTLPTIGVIVALTFGVGFAIEHRTGRCQ
jgi:hypothetical protein